MKTPTRVTKAPHHHQLASVRRRLKPLSLNLRRKRRGLSAEGLDELHPHHVVLSVSGSILQTGPALSASMPELRRGDPAERFFAFRQSTSHQVAGITGAVRPFELALHDGFEVMATSATGKLAFEHRYRVHFRERNQEIWLLEVSGPSALATAQVATASMVVTPTADDQPEDPLEGQPKNYFEALSALASGLSHELNNLLMGILGNTELLGLSINQVGPRQNSMLDSIRDNADRAAHLCDQLLLFSGREECLKDEIDPKRFLDSLSIGDGNSTLDPTINVRIEMEQPGPKIFGDAVQLRQLTCELVRNAIEASSSGDTVRVRLGKARLPTPATEPSPNRIEISTSDHDLHHDKDGMVSFLEVIDQGHGMSPEVLARTLEPFFTTRFLGRGLGLSAVLGITRAHGGTIAIESHPGVGTRVRISLPHAPATRSSAAAETPASEER